MKDFYAWFSEGSSVKVWIFKCSPPLWRFYPFICWFPMFFRCEGLRFPPFTSVHRPCECFAAHVNPLKSKPSQSNPCKSEGNEHCVNGWIHFSGNVILIYTRVKEPSPNRLAHFQRDYSASSAQPDAAWSMLHKSPTISHKSRSRQNKSRSRQNKSWIRQNKSGTCESKRYDTPFRRWNELLHVCLSTKKIEKDKKDMQ